MPLLRLRRLLRLPDHFILFKRKRRMYRSLKQEGTSWIPLADPPAPTYIGLLADDTLLFAKPCVVHEGMSLARVALVGET
jgi:hypothetical protein